MTNEDEIFSSRARELRDEGDRALQQQQLRNALTAYERGLNLADSAPTKASLHSRLAAAYTRADESVDTVREADHALALVTESAGDSDFTPSDHARALVCRATAYTKLDEFDKAAADVQSAEAFGNSCSPDTARTLSQLKSFLRQRLQQPQQQQSDGSSASSTQCAASGSSTQSAAGSHDASAESTPAGLGGMGLNKKATAENKSQQQQHGNGLSSSGEVHQQQQDQQRKRSDVVNLKATLHGDTRNMVMMKGVALSDVQDAIRRRFPEQEKAFRMYTSNGSLITSDADLLAATDSALARHRQRIEQLQQEQQHQDVEAQLAMPAPMHVTLEHTRPGYSGSDRDASELEDWVLEFTSVFREHAGVDAETHCELINEGTKKTNGAIDPKVSIKDARIAFDDANSKFNEAAAYALANCGNCYLLRARRLVDAHRPPPANSEEGNSSQPPTSMPKEKAEKGEEFLQEAEKRFSEALKTSPKHVDALVGRVQLLHERARLLSADVGEETEERFRRAEKTYTDTEKAFEGVIGDIPDQPRLMEQPQQPGQDVPEQIQTAQNGGNENEETSRSMRAQVRVLWGNVLFEHSQLRARQGGQWSVLLDKACVQFRRAGCSQDDIDKACASHLSRLPSDNQSS